MEMDNRAINAIWKTTLKSPEEKLVLYQLAAKHELGEAYSSSWKSIDAFLKDFQVKWCHLKELKDATKLSDLKLQRAITDLVKRGYIVTQETGVKLNKSESNQGETQTIYGITEKIFRDFADTIGKTKATA